MLRLLLLVAAATASARPCPALAGPSVAGGHPSTEVQEAAEDPWARSESAADARDGAALGALFRELPAAVLPLFDRDLEGALATWEAAPETPDRATIERLLARALFAAEVAGEVTGRPIFSDYAASFAGWDAEQKQAFRAGQRAFGEGRRALSEGDPARALELAVRCRELALPLGDWWGTAMGLELEGRALAALERHAEALAAASRARLLYAQLGLVDSELANSLAVADAAEALGRLRRAHAAVVAAQRLVGEGREELAARLAERRAALEARLAEEAAATAR